MKYSTKGWLIVGAVIGVIEWKAPPDDMLSHAVDAWLEHPLGRYFATAGVLITASHLLNKLPSDYDPFTWAFKWKTTT